MQKGFALVRAGKALFHTGKALFHTVIYNKSINMLDRIILG